MSSKVVTIFLLGLTAVAAVIWSQFDTSNPVLIVDYFNIGWFAASGVGLKPSALLAVGSLSALVLVAWLWKIKRTTVTEPVVVGDRVIGHRVTNEDVTIFRRS